VCTAIGEGLDAQSQRGETQIDFLRFFQCVARRASLCNALTSRQVDEVEATCLLRPIRVELFVRNDENSVAARTPIVLVCRRYGSGSLTIHQSHENVVKALD